ncbi:Protein IMPACT [Psilocybe cubensis]|uniref:Protein IMPACT n=2 Tax=Psilocybe cubensis TaxID=181762 RepID=A0ACB8H2N6_PSICU|nr:Protein IMPACT [Psilocybe cubensis]KAH9482275.1 Protein IMPACT [Psilocybe cubensis]
MHRTPSPDKDDNTDKSAELQDFLAALLEDPEREAVASEIQVLQSIYGDDAIRLWRPPLKDGKRSASTSRRDGTIRYEVVQSLPSPHDDVSIKILVSLPETYPKSAPPQLQLLSKYIGSFGADAQLFGSILRTYISVSGVEWSEDTVCVFDGLQNVLERCVAWYEDRLSAEKAGELVREDVAAANMNTRTTSGSSSPPMAEQPGVGDQMALNEPPPVPAALPAGVHIYVAEPITDRKSAFIGRACRIHHPSEVPLILSHLMSDRRISRAAHPIINAWRCQLDSVLHQDNDDDGETAAGGRLAHLLQILEVNDVLVVVTRYFGGIHLGPDRFKHINQAARNALELGGFLDAPEKKNTGRGKKH